MSILGDFDFYPGSKTPRKHPVVVVDDTPPQEWDAHPIRRTIRGKEMEFFGVGALAQALGRSIVSIRLWERRGYIPRAPYRMPDHQGGRGKRLYTRAIIEATIDEFHRRGFLGPDGARKILWADNQDLTIRLVERWAELVEIEKHN